MIAHFADCVELFMRVYIVKADAAKLNAVQLTSVEAKKFLSIYYASIGACLRHVQ